LCIYISEGNKKKNGGISMNRLTVVGRIVREVTLKQVGEDRIVLNNVIAVQRLFKSENGQEDSGERQYVIEMNVDHVQFLQPKKDKTTNF